MVDDEHHRYLSQFKWHAHGKGNTRYARRVDYSTGKKRNVFMHRIVIGAKDGEIVDHVNHNGLDNQKANLRIVSNGQNIRNSERTKGQTGYYGVWSFRGKYRAVIYINRKSVHIGVFDTAEEAAKAYDQKSIELFNDGKLNFPQS